MTLAAEQKQIAQVLAEIRDVAHRAVARGVRVVTLPELERETLPGALRVVELSIDVEGIAPHSVSVTVRGGSAGIGWPGLRWRRLNEEPSR